MVNNADVVQVEMPRKSQSRKLTFFGDKSQKSTENETITTGGQHSSSAFREAEEHDKKSAQAVKRLKCAILTFFMLTTVGVLAAFFVYRAYDQKNKNEAFEARFEEDSTNMLRAFGMSIDSILSTTDSLAISMLAQAKATNQTYPFVTYDDWNVQAAKFRMNTGAYFITTYAVVQEEQRDEWEAYAAAHNDWIEDAIAHQGRDRAYLGPNITEEWMKENYTGHYDKIHGYDEYIFGDDDWYNSTDGVSHEGVSVVLWQCSPVIPTYPQYNWDLSTAAFKDPWYGVVDEHLVTITEPYMIAHPWDTEKIKENENEAQWLGDYLRPGDNALEPVSDIYYPLIPSMLDNVFFREEYPSLSYKKEDHQLGAYLALSMHWGKALTDLLPEGTTGVTVVFQNHCAEAPPFTYEISGPIPKYLGTDIYNSSFAEMNRTLDMMDVWDFAISDSTYSGIPINEDLCPFTLTVYPAESSKEIFLQNSDQTVYVVLVIVLSVAVLTIGFTLLFFYLYDRLVRNEITSKINLLDAKRNFVRFVSHEVRTPLNTVSMGLTLVHQDLDERRKKLIKDKDDPKNMVTSKDLSRWATLTKEVTGNAEVAVGVLNDLLNIDKIQMGAFKLEYEVLDIWKVIENTTMEFKMMAAKQKTDLKLDLSSLAEQKDIEMAITSTAMLPFSISNQKVVGDITRLQQVLRNLLSNAIKFSKGKSVTVKVSVRDAPDVERTKNYKLSNDSVVDVTMSGRIVVEVIDTGVGMTPSQLETVFDIGTQFNANKLQAGGGTGLGLAFAKAISEQHNGSLRAYSDGREKGTTFNLTLPLYFDVNDREASNKRPASSRAIQQGQEEKLVPMRILVCDDALMNRKLLIRLLESNGHSCGEAHNGQALIDVVDLTLADDKEDETIKKPYDCILVDYEMPVMNGPEACKAIRDKGYHGFVVGVTGNLLPEDVGYFMDCGADAVLPKPFKYNDLEQLLIEQGLFPMEIV